MKIHFLWDSCITLSPIPDLMRCRVGVGEGKEEEKKIASNLLFMFGCLCVCFVFLYKFQHALLKVPNKSLTRLL